MTRHVLPDVLLARGAALVDADAAERTAEVVGLLRGAGLGLEDTAAAVSLRWTLLPHVGLPRAPFEVWRLSRRPAGRTKVGDVSVAGTATADLPSPCRQVEFTADAATALTVAGLDATGRHLPGQSVTVPAGRRGALRAPGIARLHVSGSGTLRGIVGLSDHDLANDARWTLRQRVGLPWDPGEIDPAAYDARDQGWVAPALLLPPTQAADLRLEVARTLFLPPQATAVAAVPAPSWHAPDPQTYVAETRAPASVLGLAAEVRTMLEGTDDAVPGNTQPEYAVVKTGSGPHPPGAPGTGTGTTFQVPLLLVTALVSASDTWGAVGLGLGTDDVLPQPLSNPTDLLLPPGVTVPDIEHMVSCNLWSSVLKRPVEVAAIVELEGAPYPPRDLTATALLAQQATGRDSVVRQPVRLRWDAPPQPQVYALSAGRPTGVDVLNQPSPAGGRLGYLAAVPHWTGTPAPVREAAYVDDGAVVDPSVPTTTTYVVAALDVHGRWSGWSSASRTSAPEPPLRPGLESALLDPKAAVASGGVLPCDLVVDLTWDWTERSPHRIELHGRYLPAAAEPSQWLGGWQAAQTGTSVPTPVALDFTAGPAPTVTGPVPGTATPVPMPPPGANAPPVTRDLRRYRVRLHGMSPAFPAGSGGASSFSVTARASEAVSPWVFSDPVGPRVAEVRDPSPPPSPALAPGVRWTALPDATGVARGVLEWPLVADATYVVWQATEPALRHAAAPTSPPPPRGTAVSDREATLTAALAAAPVAVLQAFTRVTTDPLTTNRVEVALPAAAEVLYAFRVSAISPQGVESARSGATALFAVPRREVPGPPTLEARPVRDSGGPGVRLTALAGPGPAPARFLVLRVRDAGAAADPGSMGSPVLAFTGGDAGVAADSLSTGDGRTLTRLAVVDRVAASWHPYHYRLVAEGRSDAVNGVFPGASTPSGTRSVVVPPALPPVVADVTVSPADVGGGRVVHFSTDLPTIPTPAGMPRIEVALLSATGGGPPVRTPVHAVAADTLPDAAGLPVEQTPDGGATVVVTDGTDAAGRAVVVASLPAQASGASREHVVVTVTDPVGRSAVAQAVAGA